MTGQQVEVVQERLHRPIQAVLVPKLQGQTLGETPGEDARRVEPLKPLKRRLDPRHIAVQQARDAREIADQIAGLVKQIDQVKADDAVHGIGDVDVELAEQMVP